MTTDTVTILGESLTLARSFVAAHATDGARSKELEPTFAYFTTHPFAPLNVKRLRMILERVRAIPAPRLLDVACGGGLITCALSRLGGRALGLDVDPAEIEMARAFAAHGRYDARFEAIDGITDPGWYPRVERELGGAPQVVVLAYALHHLPRVEEFVATLARHLPPGTLVLVNEENSLSPTFRAKHVLRGIVQRDTDVEWHRSREGWARLFRQHGFRDTAPTRGADMLPGLASVWTGGSWSLVFEFEQA